MQFLKLLPSGVRLVSTSSSSSSKLARNLSLHSFKPSHHNVKIAIVGSGPAALYTAQYILKNLNISADNRLAIDIYEKLPVPFGLVRYGVAPDHQDVKNVMKSFTETILKPTVNFYGNVSIGSDLKIPELMSAYTAVVLAYGSHSENYLNIKVALYLLFFFFLK